MPQSRAIIIAGTEAGVPFQVTAPLKDEHYESYQGTHHYHRMQADEAALEEFSQCQCLSPTVIVCVTDDETGKDEEEVNRQIAVVDFLDDG